MTLPRRVRRALVDAVALTDERVHRRTSLFAQDDDAGRELVSRIGREFASGYNATLRNPDPAAVATHVAAVSDDHFTPFYVEGASMALGLLGVLGLGRGGTAHQDLLDALPGHRYLTLAGWGWAHAVLPFPVSGLRRSPIWRRGGLFAGLGIDGYAFATCFLWARPPHFDLTCPFSRPEHEALWWQGYGRALWFVSGQSQQAFNRQHRRLEQARRPDLCAGFGLATAFAGLAGLTRPTAAPFLDASERAGYLQGVAFGLTARREASPRSFALWRAGLDEPDASWVGTWTDRCLRPPPPRASAVDGGYVDWQRRVRRELSAVGVGS